MTTPDLWHGPRGKAFPVEHPERRGEVRATDRADDAQHGGVRGSLHAAGNHGERAVPVHWKRATHQVAVWI